MSVYPDSTRSLLLRAALWPAEAAREELLRWSARVPGEPDNPSLRIFPAVCSNLEQAHLPPALQARLIDTYRRSRMKGLVQQLALGALLDALCSRKASFQLMLLKGAALREQAYGDCARRPMGDVDLLARPGQTDELDCHLRAAGWQLEAVDAHSSHYRGPSGLEVDLHQVALQDCRWPNVDDDFWSMSTSARLEGHPVRIPCASHNLLQACVHGSSSDGGDSPWAVDAWLLLNQVRWEVFLEAAERRRLALPCLGALTYLREQLGAEIPEWVLRHLACVPVRASERAYFWFRGRQNRGLRYFVFDLLDYRRNPGLKGPQRLGYIGHLQRRWSLASPLSVFSEVGRRAVLQVRGGVDPHLDRLRRAQGR